MPYRRASAAKKAAEQKGKERSVSGSENNVTPTFQESQSLGNASESYLTQRDVLYQASMQLDVDESDSDSSDSEPEDPLNNGQNEEPSEEQISRNNKSKVPTPFDNTKSPNKRRVSAVIGTVDSDDDISIDGNRAANRSFDSTKRQKLSGHSGPVVTVEKPVRSIVGTDSKQTTGEDGLLTMRQDISAVRYIVSGLSLDIKKHFDDRLADFKRTVMNDINEIRVLVNHGFGDQKRKKETPINEEANIPFFNIVFSDTIMQIVIEKCMIAHIISTTSDYITVYQRGKKESGGDIARGAALAVRIMLFAVNLKKKEGRIMYKSEIGTKFSEYREGIVLSALMAAKNNSFNIFRAAGDPVDVNEGDQGTHVDMNSRKPQLPAWLREDVISSKHINDARLKMEETNGKNSEHNQTPTSRTSSNSDDDISIIAATQLYKNFIHKLNSARMCVKAGFFDEVGYLFVDWKQFGTSADQSTLKLSWARDKNFRCKYVDFMDVPESIPCYNSGVGEEREENQISSTNRKNKNLLSTLMDDCPEMILMVQHQVCIRKHAKRSSENSRRSIKPDPDADNLRGDSPSCSQGDSAKSADCYEDDGGFEMKETLHRQLNLIDISCRFLSCYGSQVLHRSPASFLCSSKDSLRSTYALAVLLKKLLTKAINALESNEVEERAVLDNAYVNGINLRALLPTPARQKSGVLTKSVHMFRTLFNSRCNCSQTDTLDLTSSSGQDNPENSDENSDNSFGRNTKVTTIA